MKTYVLDSYAVLAYFRKETGQIEVRQILAEGMKGNARNTMNVVNLGEVYFMLYKKNSPAKAMQVWRYITQYHVELFPANEVLTLAVAKFKSQYSTSKNQISYADCYAAALAQQLKATLVTGDPEFQVLAQIINIQFLPR